MHNTIYKIHHHHDRHQQQKNKETLLRKHKTKCTFLYFDCLTFERMHKKSATTFIYGKVMHLKWKNFLMHTFTHIKQCEAQRNSIECTQ